MNTVRVSSLREVDSTFFKIPDWYKDWNTKQLDGEGKAVYRTVRSLRDLVKEHLD